MGAKNSVTDGIRPEMIEKVPVECLRLDRKNPRLVG